MPEVRNSKATLQACLECQKRKTRCARNGRNQSCTYCARTGKDCVFEAPPSRVALTRKNFDALQEKCNRLEALLLRVGGDSSRLENLESLEAELYKLPRLPDAEVESDDSDGQGSPEGHLEWSETLSGAGLKATDQAKDNGMALISAQSSGYLGSSSASNMLKSIADHGPGHNATALAALVHRSHSNAKDHDQRTSIFTDAPLVLEIMISRLIDAYFKLYNTSYPILHERTFRRHREQRRNWPNIEEKSKTCWMAVYNIVLAIGSWILDEESQDLKFFAAARSWLSARALESGSLAAVQAFLLMGNYVQKRGMPNTGYNMIGIASRMALGLGMHRDIGQPSQQDTFQVDRRRLLFWTLFCFDSGLSITTGRPTINIEAFVDTKLPRNVDESMLDLGQVALEEVDYPTASSAIIAQTKLAMVANEIHTMSWSVDMPKSESNQDAALTMEVRLFHWRNSLPRYFTSSEVPEWFLGPRAIVLWKEQNLRLLLWRSSQRRHGDNGKPIAVLKCNASAAEAIKDICIFCREHAEQVHTGLNWYATYFLFQALLVLEDSYHQEYATRSGLKHQQASSSFANNTSLGIGLGDDEIWRQAMDQGRKCLKALDNPYSTAGRCYQTLDRLSAFRNSGQPVMLETEEHAEGGKGPHQATIGLDSHTQQQATGADAASMSDMISPDALYTQWTMSADPSMQLLLDDRQMDGIFRGVQGFPGTLHEDSFDYVEGWSFENDW